MPKKYAQEFPDYPAESMPDIPQGFRDSSWHNDSCPSFTGFGLQVIIDYPNPVQREIQSGKRFMVLNDPETLDNNDSLFESDDWPETLAFIDANKCQIAYIVEMCTEGKTSCDCLADYYYSEESAHNAGKAELRLHAADREAGKYNDYHGWAFSYELRKIALDQD